MLQCQGAPAGKKNETTGGAEMICCGKEMFYHAEERNLKNAISDFVSGFFTTILKIEMKKQLQDMSLMQFFQKQEL